MSETKWRILELIAEHNTRGGEKLTLKKIAEDTKLDYRTLREMANNTSAQVRTKYVATLCDYFDCSPGDLFLLVPPQPQSRNTVDSGEVLRMQAVTAY